MKRHAFSLLLLVASAPSGFRAQIANAQTRLDPPKLRDEAQATTKEARTFATSMLEAMRLVQDQFIRDVKRRSLAVDAILGLYREVKVEIPAKVAVALTKTDDLSEPGARNLLIEARLFLGARKELSDGKDLTLALKAMLSGLDSRCEYLDPDAVRRIIADVQVDLAAIGLQVRVHVTRDQIEVITPIYGSPAYKAGIRAGDVITHFVTEVDNQGKPLATPRKTSTKGMSLEDALKAMRGKEGTKLGVILEKKGTAKPTQFELTRRLVATETVLGHKRKADHTWDYVIDSERRICYARLTQFSPSADADLKRILDEVSGKGINGFILDLRYCPGGLLGGAVKVCDLFIEDGLLLSIRTRKGPDTVYFAKSRVSFAGFPIACLVNRATASGGEVVAACLQDHNRAIVVGERTYGKCNVQTIHRLEKGIIKLTTASFQRPSGKNLDKSSADAMKSDVWGVRPNRGFELKLKGQDEQKELAIALRQRQLIERTAQHGKQAPKGAQDRQLDLALRYLREQIRIKKSGSTK